MLTNLILWVRTILMVTPTQWASDKPSDKDICDAINIMIFDHRNNHEYY